MKRKVLMGLLGTAMAVSLAQNAGAQGTIKINNYDSSAGLFIGNFTTSAPSTTYVELLGGASAGSLVGLIGSTAGSAIFQLSSAGYTQAGGGAALTGSYFNAGTATVSGVANNGTAFLQLLVWSGAATYASATYQFESAVWSQAIGTAAVVSPPTAANPAALGSSTFGTGLLQTPVVGNVSGSIPNNNNGIELVSAPEPSSLALAGLGGFGMLMAMRRKKA